MYGVAITGPPGSGKSVFCRNLCDVLSLVNRPYGIVNLDPANEHQWAQLDEELDGTEQPCSTVQNFDGSTDKYLIANICDLISVDDVMESFRLGPNGSMVYCIEFLEKNIEWLTTKLEKNKHKFIIFDMPGQTELYTAHQGLQHIFDHLMVKCSYNICAINLIDSTFIKDITRFISMSMHTLSQTLSFCMPSINVLSKIDIFRQQRRSELALGGPSAEGALFDIEDYTEGYGLEELLDRYEMGTMEGAIMEAESFLQNQEAGSQEEEEEEEQAKNSRASSSNNKLRKMSSLRGLEKLTRSIAQLIDSQQMLSFLPVQTGDREMFCDVLRAIDDSVSYYPGALGELNGLTRGEIEKIRQILDGSIKFIKEDDYIKGIIEEHI